MSHSSSFPGLRTPLWRYSILLLMLKGYINIGSLHTANFQTYSCQKPVPLSRQKVVRQQHCIKKGQPNEGFGSTGWQMGLSSCAAGVQKGERFRWARCKQILPMTRISRAGLPLPANMMDILHPSLAWEDIQVTSSHLETQDLPFFLFSKGICRSVQCI